LFDKLQFVGLLLFFRERKVSKRKLLQKKIFYELILKEAIEQLL